jgi:hypothetical protein
LPGWRVRVPGGKDRLPSGRQEKESRSVLGEEKRRRKAPVGNLAGGCDALRRAPRCVVPELYGI